MSEHHIEDGFQTQLLLMKVHRIKEGKDIFSTLTQMSICWFLYIKSVFASLKLMIQDDRRKVIFISQAFHRCSISWSKERKND